VPEKYTVQGQYLTGSEYVTGSGKYFMVYCPYCRRSNILTGKCICPRIISKGSIECFAVILILQFLNAVTFCRLQEDVRISKKDYESDRAKMYGPVDAWYHVDCFLSDRDDLDFDKEMDISKIGGFAHLRKIDKDDILAKFGKPVVA
jgi:hypothetical protein